MGAQARASSSTPTKSWRASSPPLPRKRMRSSVSHSCAKLTAHCRSATACKIAKSVPSALALSSGAVFDRYAPDSPNLKNNPLQGRNHIGRLSGPRRERGYFRNATLADVIVSWSRCFRYVRGKQKQNGHALGKLRVADENCWPLRLARFAKKYALPVCTTFRRGHLFDQTHPCYAGDLGIGPNPKLLERIKSSDLVIVIGGRLGELPSQHYTLFDIPRPQTQFVHVHPGAEELGRVYSPHLAINATPTAFTAALEELKFKRSPAGDPRRRMPIISPGRKNRPNSRAPSISAPSWCRCATIFPPTQSYAAAPATMQPGCIVSFVSGASASMWRQPRARWGMACPRRWR
jgi:Thiamine pyrophosphate enzyme, central domain